jgi:hypothetical protein
MSKLHYGLLIRRLQTVCILVLINILLTGSLSEIAFAFERRQKEEQQISQSTMKTHLDALWWATSLRFIATNKDGHLSNDL